MKVSAFGGTPEAITLIDQDQEETAHLWPEVLPGGQGVLFTIRRGGDLDAARIGVLSLQTGQWQIVVEENGHHAKYVSTGHIVYGRGKSHIIVAAQFDLDNLEVTSAVVQVLGEVSGGTEGVVDFSASSDGSLAYVPAGETLREIVLVWVDREGREELLPIEPMPYRDLVLAPLGGQVAFWVDDLVNRDVLIYDLQREVTRLTFDPALDRYPIWTPDGQEVVFASARGGTGVDNLFRKHLGTGQVQRLTEAPNSQRPLAFSPDGKLLVFQQSSGVQRDLGVHWLQGENKTELLLQSESDESFASISPDGRWMAYVSDASGTDQVYVRPLPDVKAGLWGVSRAGGRFPVWGRDGRELFYVSSQGVMVVAIQTEPTFAHDVPEVLFDATIFENTSLGRAFDVAPDGRLLMLKVGSASSDEGASPPLIVVVENWFEELKERVPVP